MSEGGHMKKDPENSQESPEEELVQIIIPVCKDCGTRMNMIQKGVLSEPKCPNYGSTNTIW